MISSKNILQEYFQKNKLPLPKYQTSRCQGCKDNDPVWEARIICDENEQIFCAQGKTKTEAELKVAKLMYDFILKEAKPDNINLPKNNIIRQQKINDITEIQIKKYNTIILVDGENCDISFDKLSDNILVLIFVAKNTTKNIVFQQQAKYNNCYVFISESVGKDAADHYLTFIAGKLSMMDSMIDKKSYVLTKDHYGEFLEKFMPNCKFICSLEELVP